MSSKMKASNLTLDKETIDKLKQISQKELGIVSLSAAVRYITNKYKL